MKHELFVEQPNMELKKGIVVKADTELFYKNEKVEQVLKNMVLETILNDEGTNGTNAYKSKSYLQIGLNAGDILLFDETRVYYMPPYPMSTVEDAISDLDSLKDIQLSEEDSDETGGSKKENTGTD